jgi:hypothetical protein
MAQLLNFLLSWLDVIVFMALTIFHVLSWLGISSPDETQNLPDRQFGATSMSAASTASITAVRILIPASLLIVQVGFGSNIKPLPNEALNNIFIAAIWFLFSLIFGLLIVWTGVMRSQNTMLTGIHVIYLIR